jgi:PUA-domain protein
MKKAVRNKEAKELVDTIKSFYNLEFSKKDNFMTDENIILINNEPLFFYFDNKPYPSLNLLLKNNFLKKITVDMGAVKFVVNGADVMRPGITNIEENIKKIEPICIIDQNYSKPLAVGIALYSSSEMQSMSSGKVIKNIHWVGDGIWEYH